MAQGRIPGLSGSQEAVAPIALLLGVAALAWLLSVGRMAGMDAGPGTDPGTIGFYLTTWVVMMAAMVLPSIAPMVRAWAAFGLGAYALLELGRALHLGVLDWDRGGPYFAAAAIVVAAAYQLTPAKAACLSKCSAPLDSVREHWRDGLGGSLRMGVEHGAWCIGCCWALMVALFALGAMSIAWMAFVAALIAIEKLAPWKAAANHTIAVGLVVLGLAVAVTPARVPGLTVPSSTSNAMTMQEAR